MAKELFKKDEVNAQRQLNRDFEYRTIAQPIFMQVQMGKATMEEFQATVAEIDARHPFVDADFELEMDNTVSVNIFEEVK